MADALLVQLKVKRDNPKVVCSNATERSDVMNVGSVSGCKNTLDHCSRNR